jgi:hypothetical protein
MAKMETPETLKLIKDFMSEIASKVNEYFDGPGNQLHL